MNHQPGLPPLGKDSAAASGEEWLRGVISEALDPRRRSANAQLTNEQKAKALGVIEVDLSSLKASVDGDFQKNVWGNWPEYVERFNQLASCCHELHIMEFRAIEKVPNMQLSSIHGIGGGTEPEKAKMTEISNRTAHLLSRISLFKPGTPVRIQESMNCAAIQLCARFHHVALGLARRYQNRQAFKMEDEYDVQDLLRALLSLFYDDIRPEEWTPSYAGKSTRMDFLLKKEKMVIEVKKTRDRLGTKEVGEELIIDVTHYKEHPDCQRLLCFVYDPEHRIENPRGLEEDIERQTTPTLEIKVLVVPRM